MAKNAGIVLIALLCILSMALGLWHSATTYSGFWAAFVPSAWANVIGVSVAAVVGIPIGFAINHYVLKLAEQRRWREQVAEVRGLLQHVKAEVDLHSGTLLQLGQVFPLKTESPTSREIPPPDKGSQTTQPVSTPDIVATLFLQEVHGRRAISDRNLAEIGESLVIFELGSYYARVGELNRLLSFRIQYSTHPGAWEREINSCVAMLWTGQAHVKLEIDQAIERLGKRATQ
jgi:hypothetical protein